MSISAHAARLSRLFTSEYARRINAQIVHPVQLVVVKENELESSLSRPSNVAVYEPDRPVPYLAATLAYGIIKGHPFMDGNNRTGVVPGLTSNEYRRALGISGLVDELKAGQGYEPVGTIAKRHMNVAAGISGVEDLLGPES